MKLYARRSIHEWEKETPEPLRSRARKMLGAYLADNLGQANSSIDNALGTDGSSSLAGVKFIPMVTHPNGRQFEHAFFAPLPRRDRAELPVAFDLCLLVNGQDWLAFRYEPRGGDNYHDYGHVQMSRKAVFDHVPINTPAWIPTKYPAHPLGVSEPLGMFLSLLTAVHGYRRGMSTVLADVLSASSRVSELPTLMDMLEKQLG